jgi:hypothetical protein
VRTRKEITMETSLWETREERNNNRFAIWIETFEPDAKRDWEDMQGQDKEEVATLLEGAKHLWKRSDATSQRTIATRAQKVGLSPKEYLAVFLAHLPDLDAVEEQAETMVYLARDQQDLN